MSLPTHVSHALAANPFAIGHGEFDQMLDRLFNDSQPANGVPHAPFSVDIREDKDGLYIEAELPGFKKEEVDITLENQVLTITAQRGAETKEGEEKKGELILHERRYNKFVRSFGLPPTVDGQSVDARLTDGVLSVTFKKREESKPRKIAVA